MSVASKKIRIESVKSETPTATWRVHEGVQKGSLHAQYSMHSNLSHNSGKVKTIQNELRPIKLGSNHDPKRPPKKHSSPRNPTKKMESKSLLWPQASMSTQPVETETAHATNGPSAADITQDSKAPNKIHKLRLRARP